MTNCTNIKVMYLGCYRIKERDWRKVLQSRDTSSLAHKEDWTCLGGDGQELPQKEQAVEWQQGVTLQCPWDTQIQDCHSISLGPVVRIHLECLIYVV